MRCCELLTHFVLAGLLVASSAMPANGFHFPGFALWQLTKGNPLDWDADPPGAWNSLCANQYGADTTSDFGEVSGVYLFYCHTFDQKRSEAKRASVYDARFDKNDRKGHKKIWSDHTDYLVNWINQNAMTDHPTAWEAKALDLYKPKQR
ncbi:hypothetical protein IE81DRAFT_331508 [Ceraceosorus guamensis]|uniref:Uncharacterized protein n=1 Tax=Ceraceosorus guamensis TaxID=1522189 RepID=A0A316VSN6_9BASI|nr:hypothetical protein IE81DRAFT_331508 [Ceraceosorus guamensis]PWN40597.1 hypothetical protein IE81DRAFT_331508 [Ceraceosorus guamensis]